MAQQIRLRKLSLKSVASQHSQEFVKEVEVNHQDTLNSAVEEVTQCIEKFNLGSSDELDSLITDILTEGAESFENQRKRSEVADEDLLPISPEDTPRSCSNSLSGDSLAFPEMMTEAAYYSPDQMAMMQGYSTENIMTTEVAFHNQDYMNQELVCEEVSPVAATTAVSNYSGSSGSMKNVKRDLCQFWMKGCCERGVTCTYAHGEHQIGEEIVASPVVTCKFWLEGRCRQGSKCKWAHVQTSDPNELFAQAPEDAKQAAKFMLNPKKEALNQWHQTHQNQQNQGNCDQQQWGNNQQHNQLNNLQWNQTQQYQKGYQQNWNQTQQWGNTQQHNQQNQSTWNNQQNSVRNNQNRQSYEHFNRGNNSNRYSNTSVGSTIATSSPTNSDRSMMQTVQGLQDEARATAGGVSAPINVSKPATDEERLKLLALLGDVVAALK